MSPPSLVEADWPDAYRVNCFVRGAGDDATAGDALAGFHRIPTWMWRNTVIVDLVGKLRTLNSRASRSVGFYGLDLYSLHASTESVVRYLETVDPDAAKRAKTGSAASSASGARATGKRTGTQPRSEAANGARTRSSPNSSSCAPGRRSFPQEKSAP